MHGGGTTQLAPVVCEQKYVALQADVVCVGPQPFAHFLFTGFRVFGKDSEASGDSGATRWNSLNPLSHQVMEKYPGEPPDQVCLHPLVCKCARSFYCANPLRLGIYLLPQHSTTFPDLLPFDAQAKGHFLSEASPDLPVQVGLATTPWTMLLLFYGPTANTPFTRFIL